MSKLAIYDMKGAAVGDVEFADNLIVTDKGEQAVHDAVVAHLAGIRSGTASTLSKGEVAGSNKKPWRQKGTGRARAGLRQSPVWRGGGVAFGPKPRSYAMKVNRKVARLAFHRAFSEKVQSGSVRVLEGLKLEAPRTRALAGMLKAMKLNKRVLILVDSLDRNVTLACRNMPDVEVVRANDVSVYQLLRHPNVLVTREGMDRITERLTRTGKGAE